jgi:hypothetical protein
MKDAVTPAWGIGSTDVTETAMVREHLLVLFD